MHDIGIVLEALLMKSPVKCVQQDLQIVIDVDSLFQLFSQILPDSVVSL